MKIKTLNFILRTLLMIVGIGIGTFTFLFARSYGPANYEIVDVDIKIPYEFSRFDGKKIQSNYIVAIHKNKLVAYDPEYKNSSDFKESYLKELESLVPAYNYNFIQRHILAFSIVITIIVALLFQQLIARFIRDLCLLIATLLSKSFLGKLPANKNRLIIRRFLRSWIS